MFKKKKKFGTFSTGPVAMDKSQLCFCGTKGYGIESIHPSIHPSYLPSFLTTFLYQVDVDPKNEAKRTLIATVNVVT